MNGTQNIQVSVIIPVHNIEAHLRQCLDSVSAQTFPFFEVICVDDGSMDRSLAILADYAAKDRRFSVLRQENAGPGIARNRGLAAAQGEYVVFLDSDDWVEPNFLSVVVERAKETGADVTLCRAEAFDTHTGQGLPSQWMRKDHYLPGGCFTPEEITGCLFQFTYGWPWDKLYRTEFIRGQGLAYPPLPHSEDLVFVFLSLALADKLAVSDEVLVHHRVNRQGSVSNTHGRHPEAAYQAVHLLQEELKRRGRYPAVEHSFLNWAMEFLIWHMTHMDHEAARPYARHLRKTWLPELGFQCHPPSYYSNKSTYVKYLLVRFAPHPILFRMIRGYKEAKERWTRGNYEGSQSIGHHPGV